MIQENGPPGFGSWRADVVEGIAAGVLLVRFVFILVLRFILVFIFVLALVLHLLVFAVFLGLGIFLGLSVFLRLGIFLGLGFFGSAALWRRAAWLGSRLQGLGDGRRLDAFVAVPI